LNKNVLYITYDGLSDPLGQSQIIPYLAELANHGYNITILSCEKEKKLSKEKEQISKYLSGKKIDWHFVSFRKNPPLLSTLYNLLQLKRNAFSLYKQKEFSIVHCRSYLASLIGLDMKNKFKTKFIFDMRGFWADERVDGNLWDTNNYIFKKIFQYFKNKEKEFIIRSDAVVSLTENGKKEIISWNMPNLNSDKIIVIPCAADEKVFTLKTKESQKAAKEKLNLHPDEFILSYIGSLGTWYLLDEMLCFFSVLKSIKHNSKFLFLTPDKKEEILRVAPKYGLHPENFVIRFCQRNELAAYAHASDISIFFIKPSYSKKASSPTKMGELLSMGIPILCNGNVGDVEEIIKKTKSGICINDFSKETFEHTIKEMDKLLNLSPQTIKDSSSDYFKLNNGISSYLSIYNKLS